MTENIKHIIALVIVLCFIGAFFYVSKNDTLFKNHQMRAAKIQEDTARLKKEVIAPLERLDDVKIDIAFFSAPAYTALQNISKPLSEPSLQRQNPFDPVF